MMMLAHYLALLFLINFVGAVVKPGAEDHLFVVLAFMIMIMLHNDFQFMVYCDRSIEHACVDRYPVYYGECVWNEDNGCLLSTQCNDNSTNPGVYCDNMSMDVLTFITAFLMFVNLVFFGGGFFFVLFIYCRRCCRYRVA